MLHTTNDHSNTDSPANTRKPALLPPHIAWPGLVIALILFSVGSSAAILLAARSDGGVQLVENYYHKAVHWDSLAAVRQASEALGWSATLRVTPTSSTHQILVSFTDQDGLPLTHLRGTVQAFRPQKAAQIAAAPFVSTDTPGEYQLTLPLNQKGLWDFRVEAFQDQHHFTTTLRKTL